MIHTVKGVGVVNNAKLDDFLELSCFFNDPADVGNLIFGSSAFSSSLIAQLEKNAPAMQDTPVRFLHQEDPLEKGKATHSSILGLPCGSAGEESTCNAGDLGLIPGLGRSLGEGKGYPLYSGLEKSMNYIVHGITKSLT